MATDWIEEIRRNRLDLPLITGTENPDVGIFAENKGVKIEVVEWNGNKELALDLDDKLGVMSTGILELLSMEKAVTNCPDGARVFIAGLGLGLILLSLAESGKANEVIVCEIEQRLIDLLGGRFKQFFADKFPLSIIQGDAFGEVGKLGKFDWIFFDTNEWEKEAHLGTVINHALTTNGVYTTWRNCEVKARDINGS